MQSENAARVPGHNYARNFCHEAGQVFCRQESIQSTFQFFEKPSSVHLIVRHCHLQGRVTGNALFCRRPGLIQPEGSVLAKGTTGNQKTPQPVILRGTVFTSEVSIYIPLSYAPRKLTYHESHRYVSLMYEGSAFSFFQTSGKGERDYCLISIKRSGLL